MYIERRHKVGKKEAIHKIDSFLDDLMRRQFPGGITIKEPSRAGPMTPCTSRLRLGRVSLAARYPASSG